jgi:hypothetical protein
VAQEFIEREGLEREYLDQIVNFIITKTSPLTIGQEPIIDIPFAGSLSMICIVFL